MPSQASEWERKMGKLPHYFLVISLILLSQLIAQVTAPFTGYPIFWVLVKISLVLLLVESIVQCFMTDDVTVTSYIYPRSPGVISITPVNTSTVQLSLCVCSVAEGKK